MELRLTYNGPLYSDGDALLNPDKAKRRNVHKHAIRSHLHHQLEEFWREFPGLQNLKEYSVNGARVSDQNPISVVDYIANENTVTHGGGVHRYRFVPLLRKSLLMTCSLRITYLRRKDAGEVVAGSIVSNSDIDNKLKVIFDALSIPKAGQLPDEPNKFGDDPIYVLLQDDKLITHVSVETDWLLGPLRYSDIDAPQKLDNDDNDARIVIAVKMDAYSMRMGLLNGNMF